MRCLSLLSAATSVETCQVNRFWRLKFLVWSIENALAGTSNTTLGSLAVSLVCGLCILGILLVLDVHGLWKFHLLSSSLCDRSSCICLLRLRSLDYWHYVLLVLTRTQCGIWCHHIIDKRWLISVLKIPQAKLPFEIETPRINLSIFSKSEAIFGAASDLLECGLTLIKYYSTVRVD